MDLIKHLSLFDPRRVEGTVAIVGVGALGSALAIQLGKLGLENLLLFDHDRIEHHNLPNQILYGPDDVGNFKADAAAAMITRLCGGRAPRVATLDATLDATGEPCSLRSKAQLRDEGVTHVFVCVDSMAAREYIFKDCVYMNPTVTYFSEGRMNAREVTMTHFDPREVRKSKEYVARLYPDEDVQQVRGTCGNILSLGATAMSLACQMTWGLINQQIKLRDGAKATTPAEELSYAVDHLNVHHVGAL